MFMRVFAWIAFIGFMIEAGAILFSYIISYYNQEAAGNLYMNLNLIGLQEYSFWQYTMSVSFMVAYSCLKAYVAFLLIKTLSGVNLVNPFKIEVAMLLEKISHVLFGISIVAIVYNAHSKWLMKRTSIILEKWPAEELIFMTLLVFVITQVYKRGVEIQSEHELTV